ncbi:hypothetical protein Mp_1g02800 [Marchantia polymorpha subsp. ruderalis]|uniref:Uncharacterized protein n=1 Tax=Marchantia polymorpha subsp. ruderalis TaxID=1480154 RepID=A0AAF6AKU9_MARPO|nr:hypothetical protein Mp_1g02800 [Marchantia polymorpha subsp. ruderalis]
MGPCRAVEPEKGARRSRSRSSVWRDQDRLRCCFRRCERTGKRRVGRPRLATRRRADRTTTRFASRFRRRLSSSSHGTSRSRPATVPELASERTDRGRGLDRALLFCNANLAPVAHPAPDLCLSSRLLSSPSPNPHQPPAPTPCTHTCASFRSKPRLAPRLPLPLRSAPQLSTTLDARMSLQRSITAQSVHRRSLAPLLPIASDRTISFAHAFAKTRNAPLTGADRRQWQRPRRSRERKAGEPLAPLSQRKGVESRGASPAAASTSDDDDAPSGSEKQATSAGLQRERERDGDGVVDD